MDAAGLFGTFDLGGAVPYGRRSCPAGRRGAGASDVPPFVGDVNAGPAGAACPTGDWRSSSKHALYQERDGILMWPERFGVAEVVRIKAGLGPYMASGRLQQSPQPRAGGIFRRDWWQQWTDGKYFPACSLIVGSVDGAFTEKEENDPSAMTVWGVFKHPEFPAPRIILMDGWRKHLPMHNDPQPRLQGEIALPGDPPQIVRQKDLVFAQRVRESWGLVELIAETCRKWGVHHLLIENKASGITAAQELRRLYGSEA